MDVLTYSNDGLTQRQPAVPIQMHCQGETLNDPLFRNVVGHSGAGCRRVRGLGGRDCHATAPTEKYATKNSCLAQVASAFVVLTPAPHVKGSARVPHSPQHRVALEVMEIAVRAQRNRVPVAEDMGVTENGEPGDGGDGDHTHPAMLIGS